MRKTIFTLGLMLAAALSLTNCTKNEEATFTPEVKVPFELYANMDDTRTTNNGMATEWKAGDAINVFHAVVGDIAYENDGSFSTVNGDGKFKGTLSETLDAGSSYNWYAFYPYTSQIETPANVSKGYTAIGSSYNGTQTQNGNDSKAHIAGKNYPLYGVAKNVAASAKPSITMSHASSLVEFVVKNGTGEAFVVKSIAFTAPEDIVGTYYINFASEPVVYTKSGVDYVSSTATLSVDGGADVPAAGAKFYMGIKPFTAAANSELTVNIETDKGTFEKSITLANETTFSAGQIKTITVNVNELTVPETIEFVFADEGLSNATAYTTFTKDGIDVIFGAGTNTNNVPMYYTSGEAMRMYKQNTLTISGATITNISITLSQDYDNLGLVDGQSGSLAYNSKVYTWSGNDTSIEFYNKSTAASNNQVRIQKIAITYIPDPTAQSMSVSKTSVDVTADATIEQVDVSLKNLEYSDVTVESSETWVVADLAEEVLTLNILENESTDARTATVTLSVGEFSETITINQEGKPTLETVTIAQFLEKSTSTTAWYQLTGTISNITNTTYGNFKITDETGTVDVYGLTKTQVSTNDKSFEDIGLKEGDIVTLIGTRAEYNSTAQVGGPAYYVSHEVACTAPEITCVDNLVTITAEDGATIHYTKDGTEPSISSPVYSESFTITETCTVKAFAIADGKVKSVVSVETCVYADPNAGTSKKSYTFTITTSDFNSKSYAANNNEKTSTATAGDGSTLEVKWTSNQVMYQNSAIQWQKSKGYIYNSTDLGTITNIDIDSTGGSFTTYTNSTVQPTSNGVGGYFKISVGGATGYVKSITIKFEK